MVVILIIQVAENLIMEEEVLVEQVDQIAHPQAPIQEQALLFQLVIMLEIVEAQE